MRELHYDEATNPSNGWETPEPLPYLNDDGSVDMEQINEDIYDGNLFQGSDFPPDRPADGDQFLHVSDHGNLEFYVGRGGEWISLWSRV